MGRISPSAKIWYQRQIGFLKMQVEYARCKTCMREVAAQIAQAGWR